MSDLTPFKINTSKKTRHSRIAFIVNDFKPTRISTSTIFLFKPPRISTSKKTSGEGGTLKSYLRFSVGAARAV
jgi:hypothetical protein